MRLVASSVAACLWVLACVVGSSVEGWWACVRGDCGLSFGLRLRARSCDGLRRGSGRVYVDGAC